MNIVVVALLCGACILASTVTSEVAPYYSTGEGRTTTPTTSSTTTTTTAVAAQGTLKGTASTAAAKPPKAKKGGSKGCETLPLYYKFEDVEAQEFPSSLEIRFVTDAYMKGNPNPVGLYLVNVAFINNITDDGIGTGVLSFNDGSGLNWQGPVLYGNSAVLGGAGRYACATGYLTPGSGPNPFAAYFNAVVCDIC